MGSPTPEIERTFMRALIGLSIFVVVLVSGCSYGVYRLIGG